MNAVRLVRYIPFLTVFALLLAGCGKSAAVDEGSGGGSPAAELTSVPPTSEFSAAPPAEGTGPEQPQQGGNGAPAIPVASLPIGGNAVEPTDLTPQCAQVSWLGIDIPATVSVSVTAIRIEPAAFTETGSGCDGSEPLCRDASFAFTRDQTGCYVPVMPVGPPGESAELFLDGTVRCPAGQDELCKGLAEDAQNEQQDRSITLTVPSLPPDQPTDATTSPADQQPTEASPPADQQQPTDVSSPSSTG